MNRSTYILLYCYNVLYILFLHVGLEVPSNPAGSLIVTFGFTKLLVYNNIICTLYMQVAIYLTNQKHAIQSHDKYMYNRLF